jgi:hypothetical protein
MSNFNSLANTGAGWIATRAGDNEEFAIRLCAALQRFQVDS